MLQYDVYVPSRELECVPDIWSLIEWSNWLTPRNHNRRYDTVFYMCFVESKPPSSPDGEEVNSAIVSEQHSLVAVNNCYLLTPTVV